MLFLTDAEVQERLESQNNYEVIHKKMYDSGRTTGTKNIPTDQKALIGAVAKVDGPTVASKLFGVSISQASNYSKGVSTHGNGVNSELSEKVDDRMSALHSKVLDKLLDSIDAIDDDKVKKLDPKSQTEVAKNLSTIIKNTTEEKREDSKQVVIIYAPEQRHISEYGEAITVPVVPIKN
jgi:hypothetical protein